MTDKKKKISICLDEIESSFCNIEKSSDKKSVSILRSWVRQQKAILKELNYKGKMPRQKRDHDK